MVEPSTTPNRARDEADRLMHLLPSVAHMVHMPSHIYIRTGDYAKGVLSNKKAISGYSVYKKLLNGWEGNRFTYLYHNADMQGTSAMMMGNYKEAKRSFEQNRAQFNAADTANFSRPTFSSYAQFITIQPYLLDVRFGNWKKILSQKKPISNHALHKILWLFGQGMALAKTGNINNATLILKEMKSLFNDTLLYSRRPNRNRGIDGVNIAALLLEGTIHMQQKKWNDAIDVFHDAINAEDSLRYSEPEDWRIPARQFLGQAYLLKGDYVRAQKIFEEDLVDHPNNFWTLNGLNYVLLKQKKFAASKAFLKKNSNVFTDADIKLTGAVY
jgi:tetratricopeptide (TPR) repeat protein